MSPQILSLIVFAENIHLNLNQPTEIVVCAPAFSETIRTSIIALNMVQLTPEQRTFVIKTFYEKSTLQQTRGAFGLINLA
jgi:hypothetical protein